MFSWGRGRVHWEQMGLTKSNSVHQNSFNRTVIEIFNFENVMSLEVMIFVSQNKNVHSLMLSECRERVHWEQMG